MAKINGFQNGQANPMYGKRSPSWNGGIAHHSLGYILEYHPDHPNADTRGYVYQHRLVMEKSLGRFLNKGEVVHHLNHIKSDNRIQNLELAASQSDHLSKHEFKRYEDDFSVECSKCRRVLLKTEFHKSSVVKRGLRSECKDCRKKEQLYI